jgi:hypothetical protein
MNTGPKVIRRAHPRGEAGTRISIEEAARYAAEARNDKAVRAWAQERLVRAGLAGPGKPYFPSPALHRAWAEALLMALRRERFYFPDPVDTEFIPSAACMLVGCEGLKFLGDDCDGMLVAFLGACGSVGLEGAVVGHGYVEKDKAGKVINDGSNLTHVLAAVFDGETWHLSDPSTSQPFGVVGTPVRERWVHVPNGTTMCDTALGAPCNPGQLGSGLTSLRSHGDFVGVGRPAGMVGQPVSQTGMVGELPGNLTGDDPASQARMREEIRRRTDLLAEAYWQLRTGHEELDVLRQQYLDQPIAQPGTTPQKGRWTQAEENYYQTLVQFGELAIRYGNEAADGNRPVAWDPSTNDVVILGDEQDTRIAITKNGDMMIGGPGGGVVQPALYAMGQVGLGWEHVVLGIIVALAAAAITTEICSTQREQIRYARDSDVGIIYTDIYRQTGDQKKAQEAVETITKNAKEIAASRVEQAKYAEKPFQAISDAIQTVMYGVIAVGGIGLAGWLLWRFWPSKPQRLLIESEKRRPRLAT